MAWLDEVKERDKRPRQKLEEIGGEANLLNRDIQIMLKTVRDGNQTIEQARRELSKLTD